MSQTPNYDLPLLTDSEQGQYVLTTFDELMGDNANSAMSKIDTALNDISADLSSHITDENNPHEVTKEQVGLGSVPNVATNDQVPTFAEASVVENINSGDKMSVLFGKIKKFLSYLSANKTDKKVPSAAGNLATLSIDGNLADSGIGVDDLGGGTRTTRFVIGTSTAGWSEKDCDYLCDGTADQTEINAAITALPATGGEIVILDGTYNITAKINVTKNNVSIRGNGNATILKRMFDSSVKEGVITLTGRSGCKIANLQVDGNKSGYSSFSNYGIYLDASSDNTVTCNTCSNSIIYGIYLNSSSNNTITGNICNDNNSGIYLNSSSNNTITGNICYNNTYGIYLASSSNNTITGNRCTRGTGLATDYTTSQYTIRLNGTANNYNLISNNNCMGKSVTVGGGTGNSVYGNKWKSDDKGSGIPTYWPFTLKEEEFTATEGQSVFNLTVGTYYYNSNSTFVYLWGIRQPRSSYIEDPNGSKITLSAGVPAGTKVIIEYYEDNA